MNIGIDCRALAGEMTGGGYYTLNLVRNILEADRDNNYLLCAHKPFGGEFRGGNCRAVVSRSLSGMVWQNFQLPLVLRREGVRLLHSPLFTLPACLHCPGIITVFDMTPVLFPRFHRMKVRLSFRALGASAAKAKKIIAISEHTRRDILEYLPVSEEKITVIYPGLSDNFKPEPRRRAEETRSRWAGGGRYLLHTGTLEPRKNLLFLIDVFAELLKRGHDGLNLVLVGGKGWGGRDVFRKVAECGLESRVFFAGYVPEGEMASIYSFCEAFVYPTFYEGFGLPLAEAMACGAPAIASSCSSIPEVAGDAAVLMKGWKTEEWAENIEVILKDGRMRRNLSEKGRRRSAVFSWVECARRTIDVYRSVVG